MAPRWPLPPTAAADPDIVPPVLAPLRKRVAFWLARSMEPAATATDAEPVVAIPVALTVESQPGVGGGVAIPHAVNTVPTPASAPGGAIAVPAATMPLAALPVPFGPSGWRRRRHRRGDGVSCEWSWHWAARSERRCVPREAGLRGCSGCHGQRYSGGAAGTGGRAVNLAGVERAERRRRILCGGLNRAPMRPYATTHVSGGTCGVCVWERGGGGTGTGNWSGGGWRGW